MLFKHYMLTATSFDICLLHEHTTCNAFIPFGPWKAFFLESNHKRSNPIWSWFTSVIKWKRINIIERDWIFWYIERTMSYYIHIRNHTRATKSSYSWTLSYIESFRLFLWEKNMSELLDNRISSIIELYLI